MIIQNKIDAAIEKITKETEAVPASGKDGAVRYAVRDALVNFCRQSEKRAKMLDVLTRVQASFTALLSEE